MGGMPKPSPEVRKKRWRRRGIVYGSLVVALASFWWWTPWEFDFIPRTLPNPHPAVDPDRDRLFRKGTRVLLVTAHPDDSEFYIGGFLTQLGKSAEIHQILCTDGDKTYYGPFTNASENRRVRQQEARAAAKAWNGRAVSFLGHPDGRLAYSEEAVNRVVEEIRRFRPEYVLAFDGQFPPRMSHQDHRRAGDIALEAARRSGVPRWALLFSTIAPNFVIDITDDWDRKKELLQIHASQFNGERLSRVTNMVAGMAESDGERIGVGLGEGFRCVRLNP